MLRALSVFLLSSGTLFARPILLEVESFADRGGWSLDQQFMDQMGSPYLLAHGLGVPVGDATTSVDVPPGKWRVWVRTRDWVAPQGPGRFEVVIGETFSSRPLGVGEGTWHWEDAGVFTSAGGRVSVCLHDLTGFDGRIDAIFLEADGERPPADWDARKRLLGLGEPFSRSYDLVVTGGGIAGLCAAVTAAREGLRTALVHDRPVFGGNASSDVRVSPSGGMGQPPFPHNADVLRTIRERLREGDEAFAAWAAAEPRLTLFPSTRVVSVELRPDGPIAAVVGRDVETGRETRFSAPLFVDSTGDGAVAVLAGADWRTEPETRAETGETLAPDGRRKGGDYGSSLLWSSRDADDARTFPACPWALAVDRPEGALFGDETEERPAGRWNWESGFWEDNVADGEKIRDRILRGIYGAWDYTKNKRPDRGRFAKAELSWVGYVLGKRAARRVLGDYILSEQDLVESRPQPDGVVTTDWYLDLHFPHPAAERAFGRDAFRSTAYDQQGDNAPSRERFVGGKIAIRPYAIPYRCLYSRNVGNLFLAGKDISATHVAMGSHRVMNTCGAMGTVVARAAALCLARGCLPRGLSVGEGLESLKTRLALPVPERREREGRDTAELKLVENGKAQCAIAVGADFSRPERFGAGEIGRYLQKVTGCDEVPVLADVDPKRWTDWRKLVFVEVRDLPELKPDGFVLDVRADGVTITGKDPRGALYGCYEVLKRWAGLRWLVPGEDGEYFTKKATVAAPVGRIVRNPYLPVRIFNGGLTTIEQHEWSIRNCAEADEVASAFEGTDVESVRRRDRLEDLAVRGMGRWGHVLSELMLGPGDGKTPPRALAEKLYAEHPEFFPLVDGKRKMTWGAYDPNPCVSNPALLDRMAKHMVEGLRGKRNCEAHLILGNNDTSAWCECEACRALDDPAKAGSRGARSDRFWFMVAELARRVWAELPDAKLGGWAYQDFWYPPTRVRIDPRLRVLVSFNNTCWRHAVDDPACGTNAEFRRVFGAWKKLGLVVYSFDDVHDEGSPGSYSPSEYVLWRNMLAYPELGCCGDRMAIYSPIPPYHKWAAKAGPFYGRNYRWLAMWQSCWLMAQVQWDGTLDFAKLYEECNSLYYGKAWAGGMREFRQYLTACYTNTPGCIGYGSGAPIGKSLDAPGSREKLEALLDKAILAAVAAGDERARRHVETDRDIFRLTWLAGHDRYLRNYLESEAFARKGEIVVDGVLDEPDWRDAKTIAGFERGYEHKPSEPADVKTEARVAYDRDHLYFAVTAYEPDMASVRCGKPAEVDRDSGFTELGDHIELYYQYPDMFEKAYHLAINPEGAIVDAIQKSTAERDRTFRTKAKVAVRKDADRWTVEVAVPANEIGLAPMKGMTWRVNFGRTRYLPGGRHEDTSACHGVFYSPSKFINLKLN